MSRRRKRASQRPPEPARFLILLARYQYCTFSLPPLAPHHRRPSRAVFLHALFYFHCPGDAGDVSASTARYFAASLPQRLPSLAARAHAFTRRAAAARCPPPLLPFSIACASRQPRRCFPFLRRYFAFRRAADIFRCRFDLLFHSTPRLPPPDEFSNMRRRFTLRVFAAPSSPIHCALAIFRQRREADARCSRHTLFFAAFRHAMSLPLPSIMRRPAAVP